MVRVLFACFCLGSASPDVASLCDAGDHPDDCVALCELHKATGQVSWLNWCDGSSLCTWDGVVCESDDGGRVSQLNLGLTDKEPEHVLSGTIPATLGQLSSVWYLDLTNNKFSGSIPETLGQLSNLQELDLHGNELSGTIPETLGKLPNLQLFNLGRNKLSGTIPATLGQMSVDTLDEFYLFDNELTGTIPETFGKLSKMAYFDLSNNKLIGWDSESSLCDLTDKMLDCELQGNPFVCPLPSCASSCQASCSGAIV